MILLLILPVALLSLLPYLTHRRGLLRTVLVTECVLCVLGAVCVILSVVTARAVLSDPALTEEGRAWAADTYTLWCRMSGVFAGVIGGCVLLAALLPHPMRRMRTAVTAAALVILLVLGQAYLAVAASDVLDLTLPITLWTLGCAFLVRLGAAVDAIRFCTPPAKNLPQKKKRP